MSIPGGQSLGDAIQWPSDDTQEQEHQQQQQQQQNHSCMLLVTDTIDADGRFILCHLMAAVSQQPDPHGLWLACGSSCGSEATVRSAIRRLSGRSAEHISVKSITALLVEQQILKENDDVELVPTIIPMWEQLLALIQDWRQLVSDKHPLVIIDDISTLAALIGEREAYLLAYWARDLSFEMDFHLVIRCLGTDETSFHSTIDYFGVGGKESPAGDDEVYWEAGLSELADQIVDVRPLASGYSRDAQGRFYITDKQKKRRLYNFMLLENDVRVFRKV